MKITHFSNSFILIECEGIVICCDPWVGKANYGGWHSFPEFDKSQLINKLEDVDIVYISHVHDDHLDTRFLIESNLISKKFIIKNFTFKTLLNRLKSIGVHDIHEIEPFEIFSIGGMNISILPQMSTNSDDLDEDIEYDLDTSLILSDGVHTFFNQVDTPYSTSDYKSLISWIETNYGKITIAALMAGAASEYPHRFLNINRCAEKDRIVKNSLIKLVEKLKILKPHFYFPAGGTYIIPGKFYPLNVLIAQPTVSQIIETLNNYKICTNFLHLEGGNSVNINSRNNNSVQFYNEILPVSNDFIKSIENHKSDKYDYETEVSEISLETIAKKFDIAAFNWNNVIAIKNIEIEQDIKFVLYKDLKMNDELSEILDNPIGQFNLYSNLKESKGCLTINIDHRSFYLCLLRKKVWNGTLGALCLFEREPNVFYPSVTFSLNYLIV